MIWIAGGQFWMGTDDQHMPDAKPWHPVYVDAYWMDKTEVTNEQFAWFAKDTGYTDGQKLTLGDTTLTLYLTPGHTTGTISTLVPVKDRGRPHLAASWGGTLFVFQRTPENFRRYIASAERFRDIVAKAGADVLISNHTNYDGSKIKQPALATRKPGDPHPYVIGNDAVKRYLTVASECAKAALAADKS